MNHNQQHHQSEREASWIVFKARMTSTFDSVPKTLREWQERAREIYLAGFDAGSEELEADIFGEAA